MDFSFLHVLKRYIISFLLSLVITAVLQGLLSILFAFIHPSAKIVAILSGAASYFCAFCASFFFARKCDKYGLASGLLCADFSMLILIMCGVIFFNNTISLSNLIRIFAICSLCGGAGGILGINLKAK